MVLLRNIVLILGMGIAFSLSGQYELRPSERLVLEISDELVQENIFEFPEIHFISGPFLAVSIKATPDDFQKLRIRNKASAEWSALMKDPHVSDQIFSISTLMFIESEEEFPQLNTIGSLALKVELHLYNPGHTDKTGITPSKLRTNNCECESPELLDRESWCAECPKDGPVMTDSAEFIIIHHSAGANNSNDWPAVVRSIWDLHVNVNEWDDIGYNYLVDPEGRMYVGRGDDRLGAHFCGTNSQTIGICMLGTYVDVLPPAEALQSFTKLSSWQNCKWGIQPLDSMFHPSSNRVLPALAGHRQGCATECPGHRLFEYIPELRFVVSNFMERCDSPNTGGAILNARLSEGFIALLEWSPLPQQANRHILEYKLVEDEVWEMMTIDEGVDSILIGLRPNSRYEFRIVSIFPLSSDLYSNTEILQTAGWEEGRESVKIYPNPANERINFQLYNNLYGSMAYAILDMRGNKLTESTFIKDAIFMEKEIDIQHIPSGTYILHIYHRDFQENYKIVVVH